MSSGKGGKRALVILPAIVWVIRSENTQYGMMGNIKAFSIHCHGSRYSLDPRLPDRKGLAYRGGEFTSSDEAKAHAEEIREEWRKDLQAAYEGQFRQAS